MALKQLAHKPPAPLPASPTWGVVADEDKAPSVLRFECADRTESLPYHTLTRWTLVPGAENVLTLYAGRLIIVIHGRELAPVRDALDAGQLVSIRATEDRYRSLRSGTVVTDIIVLSEGTP